MVGLGAAPAVLQVAMLVFMPETPRYLCKINKEQEAEAVLMKVYRGIAPTTNKIVNDIIRAINREITDEQESRIQAGSSKSTISTIFPPTLNSLLFHPPHGRALIITCMLQGLQQLCGFNSLMYFSATIFSLLRFASPTLTSLSIATTELHLHGRGILPYRPHWPSTHALLLTIPIMAVALLLCAAAFGFVKLPHHSAAAAPTPETEPTSDVHTTASTSSRLPAIAILTSLLLYVSAYATALGPVPWQQSELFPLQVRSLGSSLATATNWGE